MEEGVESHADLLNVIRDAIIVRDMDDRITYWNRAAEEQYGWSAVEARGRVTHQLLKTRFPLSFEDVEAELLRTGRWEGEFIHATRGGQEIVVSSRWVLRRDAAGSPSEILEINNEITRQTEAENNLKTAFEELKSSEDRYRSLFNNSRDAILLTAPEGRVFVANQVACDLFRMSEKEICHAGRSGLADLGDPGLERLLEERERTGSAKGEIRCHSPAAS